MREEGLVTGLCPNCQVGIEARAQFSSDGFGFNLGAVLLPFFLFYNEEGVLAFASNDLDPEWRGRPRPAGQYRSRVHIPGNLLAEGTLFVGAGLSSDGNILQFYEGEAVAFNVIDSLEGNSARGDFAGSMMGVVRPMLAWNTEFRPAERRRAVG